MNEEIRLSGWTMYRLKENIAEIEIKGYIGIPAKFQNENPESIVSAKEDMENELKKLANLNTKTIKLKIDSPGGDVSHAIAMYNALKTNKAKIEVEYTGFSASAATIIGSSGDVITAPNNIMLLFHEARGVAVGVSEAIKSYAELIEKLNGIAAKIYSDKSAKTIEEMRLLMSQNNGEGKWITSTEAKEYGLVDEVIEPVKIAAYNELNNILMQNNLPQLNTNQYEQIEKQMSLFNKNPKKVESIKLSEEKTAVYSGELKAGLVLAGLGCEIEDNTYEVNGQMLTIKNSTIEKIEEIKPEMFTKDQLNAKIDEAVNPLNEQLQAKENEVIELKAQLEAKQTELSEAKTKVEELSKLTSKHVPPKVESQSTKVDHGMPVLAERQKQKHEERIKNQKK